jgi:iron complex outermembrane recepter protein
VLRGENDFVARLGLGRQLARAKMNDMRASINYNFNEAGQAHLPDVNLGCSPWSGNGGNPRLRPWIADAVDLSLEKYFGREAYVSVAGYYKNLKTYIYEQSVLQDFTGFPIRGTVEPVLREGFVSIWSNGEGGKLYGFELAGALPFSTFSGFARRLRPAGQLQLHRKRDHARTRAIPPSRCRAFQSMSGTRPAISSGPASRSAARSGIAPASLPRRAGFGGSRERRFARAKPLSTPRSAMISRKARRSTVSRSWRRPTTSPTSRSAPTSSRMSAWFATAKAMDVASCSA